MPGQLENSHDPGYPEDLRAGGIKLFTAVIYFFEMWFLQRN
jgi:hypothetical protein